MNKPKRCDNADDCCFCLNLARTWVARLELLSGYSHSCHRPASISLHPLCAWAPCGEWICVNLSTAWSWSLKPHEAVSKRTQVPSIRETNARNRGFPDREVPTTRLTNNSAISIHHAPRRVNCWAIMRGSQLVPSWWNLPSLQCRSSHAPSLVEWLTNYIDKVSWTVSAFCNADRMFEDIKAITQCLRLSHGVRSQWFALSWRRFIWLFGSWLNTSCGFYMWSSYPFVFMGCWPELWSAPWIWCHCFGPLGTRLFEIHGWNLLKICMHFPLVGPILSAKFGAWLHVPWLASSDCPLT